MRGVGLTLGAGYDIARIGRRRDGKGEVGGRGGRACVGRGRDTRVMTTTRPTRRGRNSGLVSVRYALTSPVLGAARRKRRIGIFCQQG